MYAHWGSLQISHDEALVMHFEGEFVYLYAI